MFTMAAAAAGCAWMPAPAPIPTVLEAVVLDDSGSADTDRCAELGADLETALARPDVRRLDLVVLELGGSTTGNEPVPLLQRRFEPSQAAFERPGAEESARRAWIDDAVSACDRSLAPSDRSPILAAVVRAVETVHALCAEFERGGAVCRERRLLIHSDFRDNVDPGVRARLYPRRASRAATNAMPPLARLDLGSIVVSACGVSDTKTGPKEELVARGAVRDAWRQILGPDLEIAAGCPRAERTRKPLEGK
jgi:hypothetical protein